MRVLDRIQSLFTPKSLAPRLAGIDISQSKIKAVELKDGPSGLVLWRHAEVALPPGSYNKGEVLNIGLLANALRAICYDSGISEAHIAIPDTMVSQRSANLLLETLDEAGIKTLSLEGEGIALARALLTGNEPGAQLIVDIGKTTTKLFVVMSHVPHVIETIPTGGHALTLVVQKEMGVVEKEAWHLKAQAGIDPAAAHEMPREQLLSALSPIGEAIKNILHRWHLVPAPEHPSVSGIVLTGGNSALRGLSGLLEKELGIPVREGDVFNHFAPIDDWMPLFDKNESLGYGTAIGLALKEHKTWTPQ